jgi:hypothetical protein
MHAVGLAQQGDIGMIIDDEAGPGFKGHAAQGLAFLEHDAAFAVLFPVLEDAYSGPQQRIRHIHNGTAETETGIGQGVEIGFTGQYPGHGEVS